MGQTTITELQAELAALSEKLGPDTVVTYMVMPIKPDVAKRERDWRAAFEAKELAKNKAAMAKTIASYYEKASPALTKQTVELLLEIKAHEDRIGDGSLRADPGWLEAVNKKEQIKDRLTDRTHVAYFTYTFNKIARLSRTMTLDDMEYVVTDVFSRHAA